MQLHQQLGKKGVVVIGLSYEPEDKVGPFIKNDKTPYIIGAGTETTNKAYGIKGYPTFFVIDPKGIVKYVGHRFTEAKDTIDKVMKETPPKASGELAEETAAEDFKKATGLIKKKKYADAMKTLEAVVKDYADTPSGKKAKSKLDELKKDKAVMGEIREAEAKKKCTGWLQMARDLAKNGKPDSAKKYYQRVIDEFGDTSYAETARKELAELS